MSIESDHAATEYTRYLFDIVNGVQDGREVRESAFAKSEEWARELTRLLKNQDNVPKRHLSSIFTAIGILENEAEESIPIASRVREVVASIRMTFGLILAGKSHDENQARKPGVPRIL